jgi:hypothetical protein
VPVDYGFFFFAFLPVLRSMPLLQSLVALYFRNGFISFSVQNFDRIPSTIPGVAAGAWFG